MDTGRAYRSAPSRADAPRDGRRLRRVSAAPNEPPTAHSLPLSDLLGHTADALQAVRAGRSLDDALAACPADARPGTQALAFHVLRWLGSAQAVRAKLAAKAPPPAIDALLCCALALLWPPGGPPYADHTLVDQAVRAARARGAKGRDGGAFINAVLRRFVRERDVLVAQLTTQDADDVARWNHPGWWVAALRADWPAHWQKLLEADNRHPPMTLRVNARRGDAMAFVARLAELDIGARATGTHTVILDKPRPVTQIPGFAEGDVSVQDAAAQRAAPLLIDAGLPVNARVLDACAAPGGKTAHLLELADLDVLAIDRDPARLARVSDTLGRLGLHARLLAADAGDPSGWWDGARSTRSCSTRRAALRASCAAIRTCAGCAARAISAPSRALRPGCSTRCGPCSSRADGCCTAPARSSRSKVSRRSTHFCNGSVAQGAREGWPRPVICCRWPTMAMSLRQALRLSRPTASFTHSSRRLHAESSGSHHRRPVASLVWRRPACGGAPGVLHRGLRVARRVCSCFARARRAPRRSS